LDGQVLGRRVVEVVAGQLLGEDDLLATWAGATGTEALTGPVAVVAPLLPEVATVTVPADVDGAVAE